MKKHLFVFLTALAAVMVSSCKKDNDELDNPNGPWSVELMAECTSPNGGNDQHYIELAGTGTVTIDWGDGTVLENFQMPELKEEYHEENGEEWYEYKGRVYTHQYDNGTYSVKVYGQDGAITLLGAYNDYRGTDYEINSFFSIILNHCSRLQYLSCYGTFNSLELSKCTQLKQLWIGSNYLTSVDISKCTKLRDLDVQGTRLTSLDVSKCTQLEHLSIVDISVTLLDVSNCTRLKTLYTEGTKLTSLEVRGCTQLKNLDCAHNELTSLDVSGCKQLKELTCEDNQLISLNISGCTQLERLNCDNNRLPVVVMNKIYNDLPVVGQGEGRISVDRATAGDYYIAENKGWNVYF